MDDHSLKNEHFRNTFDNINCIQTMIVQARNSAGCPARQMLIALSMHASS